MKNRVFAVAFAGVVLATGPTLAAVHPWAKIVCSDTQLLAASGYPGLKRSYTYRGYCKLYVMAYEYNTYIDGTSLQTGKEYYDKLIKGFVAMGKGSWDGKTGETRESLLVEGKKLSMATNCIKDPFIEKTYCSGAQVAGDVDMMILSEIYWSKQPVFARSVNTAEAQKLSAQSGKGSNPPPPPPPPKPAITVPRVKISNQPPGGGPAKAKPPAGIPLIISPTAVPARPGGRRLRLPTRTPTPGTRRG